MSPEPPFAGWQRKAADNRSFPNAGNRWRRLVLLIDMVPAGGAEETTAARPAVYFEHDAIVQQPPLRL